MFEVLNNSEYPIVNIVDWDNEKNNSADFADWHNIAVIPAVRLGKLRGVLYAALPLKKGSLKQDDLSYLNKAATLLAAAGI